MGRITVNGTIAQFSCKLSIAPRLWNVKANKAAGKSTVAQRINEKLDKIGHSSSNNTTRSPR
ncbi:MAG: Arm DNA-binding domain-containing protein [Alistipes finegoldii]